MASVLFDETRPLAIALRCAAGWARRSSYSSWASYSLDALPFYWAFINSIKHHRTTTETTGSRG